MTIIIITRIINNSIELALKAVFNKDLLKGYATKCKYHKKELKSRQKRWQSKALNGLFLRGIKDKPNKDVTWRLAEKR